MKSFDDHFKTLISNCKIRYGDFYGKNWFGVGGIQHPVAKNIIKKIKSDLSNFLDKRYQLWLMGGILEDWITWDLDMVIIGPYEPLKIKTALTMAIKTGFNNHLFVDINYKEKLWRNDLYTAGLCEPGYYLQYEYSSYFEKDSIVKTMDGYEACDGLYKLNKFNPAKKLVEAKNKGYIYQAPVQLF
jgi:hypothetical protein